MAATQSSTRPLLATAGAHLGMVVGLGVTAASMSSGFIWASQGEILLVYVAGFFAWTGYIGAHYAVMGCFVDDMSDTDDGSGAAGSQTESSGTTDGGGAPAADGSDGGHVPRALHELRSIAPDGPVRAAGFAAGIAILVAGIAILAWYVRQENHLLGNVGSGMFLAGYAFAHYFDTGAFL